MGGPEFFGVLKEGTSFKEGSKRGGGIFPHNQRGGPEFFYVCNGGGAEKIADWPSQTDGPLLPIKNDNSLTINRSKTEV